MLTPKEIQELQAARTNCLASVTVIDGILKKHSKGKAKPKKDLSHVIAKVNRDAVRGYERYQSDNSKQG